MAGIRYKSRLCTLQVACDGNILNGKDDVCYRCKERLAVRSRKPVPLKGERTELTRGEKQHRGLA